MTISTVGRTPAADMKNRIINSSIPEPNSGCWLWERSYERCGYGQIHFGRKKVMAHRISYSVFNGEIPPGMSVLHKCDCRGCVNPEHLFLGTARENMIDMSCKGRHPFQKVMPKDVLEIRSLGLRPKDLVKIYPHISRKALSDIVNRTTWRTV